MALARDRPYSSCNFRVRFGGSGSASIGFNVVELPPFEIDRSSKKGPDPSAQPPAPLVLSRGFDGSLAVYELWNKARRATRSTARTVTVELLGEDRRSPVAAWVFRGCRPLRIRYSPLDAQASAVLLETLELSYEEMEMA